MCPTQTLSLNTDIPYTKHEPTPKAAPAAGVYAVLGRRRARVLREEMREGSDVFSVHAWLPAEASFGFVNEMRARSSGGASVSLLLSHWERLQASSATKVTVSNSCRPMCTWWLCMHSEDCVHAGARASSLLRQLCPYASRVCAFKDVCKHTCSSRADLVNPFLEDS